MADTDVEVTQPLMDCFLKCETQCLRECCGIDAISTNLVEIAEWSRDAGPSLTATALQQLKDLIAVVEDRSHKVSSLFLNHYTCHEAARKQLLEFLEAF